MRVDLFDFELPEDAIALRPAEPREAARLLVVDPVSPDASSRSTPGSFADHVIADLPDLLEPGDALVLNDTRVIPAALSGIRSRQGANGAVHSAKITVNLLEALDAARWQALARPQKRLKPGDRIAFLADDAGTATAGGAVCLTGTLDAEVENIGEGGEVTLKFAFSGPFLAEAIEAVGGVPLPPYIASRRPADSQDRADYQTVFAREDGAVAAPTAGLHLSEDMLVRLKERGIGIHFVTLHVGAGTFRPVKVEDSDDHVMHGERGMITGDTAAALNAVKRRGGQIVAVGTTSARLLETAADEDGALHAWSGSTDLFITPGYRFRCVDMLMTNFHLPRSSLLMLVAAFSGLDVIRRAYAHALESGYRFYSYGDACLLHRAPNEAARQAAHG